MKFSELSFSPSYEVSVVRISREILITVKYLFRCYTHREGELFGSYAIVGGPSWEGEGYLADFWDFWSLSTGSE